MNGTDETGLAAFGRRHRLGVDTLVIAPGTDRHRWPFLIVRHRRYTAVPRLAGHRDHRCIDVHPLTGDQAARAAVSGIEAAPRVAVAESDTAGLSHGWPATRLVCVLIGEQTDHPETDLPKTGLPETGRRETDSR